MNWKLGFFAAVLVCGVGAARPAQAQDYTLAYGQAGALLTYAEAELRILYAGVTAREYDPKIIKDTLTELKRAIGDAKRQVGRAGTLLPDELSKHQEEVEKLRTAISKAEDQLNKLSNDIDEQTKGLAGEEAEPELGERSEGDEGDEAPKVDWELLKADIGWLNVDLGTAKGLYGSVAKKLKVAALKVPPKPKGKRPE
jgi:hypothetical protein